MDSIEPESQWSPATQSIYDAALAMLRGNMMPLDYGPGHVVWADSNLNLAEWCLDNFNDYRGSHTDEDLAIAKWALQGLCLISGDER